MIEIYKLSLADALTVVGNMREEDRYAMRAALGPVSDEVFAANRWQTEGPAWSMARDGDPIAIFGLSMGNAWSAVAWLVATPAMSPESWKKLMRHCRTVLGNARATGLHRIEAQVLDGWPEADRFARRLGFEFEGTRRAAGRGGQDAHVFAILRG